jgi:hypothetical protein
LPNAAAPSNEQKARKYLSQSDVPSCSLEKALSIAQTIADHYGFKPATPVQVASALEVQPTSGPFRSVTGASIAYGLTKGGSNAPQISIEPLGMRIVKSPDDPDALVARREALIKPRVIRLFLEKYNGAAIPKSNIAEQVLLDFGVPKEKTAEVLKLIVESADSVGFLQDIRGRKYVDLMSTKIPNATSTAENENESEEFEEPTLPSSAAVPAKHPAAPTPETGRARKVFITHGKNRELIEPIKKLLKFGELEAVVSVQTQTVCNPSPAKSWPRCVPAVRPSST